MYMSELSQLYTATKSLQLRDIFMSECNLVQQWPCACSFAYKLKTVKVYSIVFFSIFVQYNNSLHRVFKGDALTLLNNSKNTKGRPNVCHFFETRRTILILKYNTAVSFVLGPRF